MNMFCTANILKTFFRNVFLLTSIALAGGAIPIQNAMASPIIDNINGNASPAFLSFDPTLTNIGWIYTPSSSYNLDGIFSTFTSANNGSPSRTVAVEIWTDRPVNGGSLLGSGTFSLSGNQGGSFGASFAPVSLTASTNYFVDFKNVAGLGVNIANFNFSNGDPFPGTTRLDSWFAGISGDTTFASQFPSGAFSAPILNFEGTTVVPVPAAIWLFSSALAGLGLIGKFRMA